MLTAPSSPPPSSAPLPTNGASDDSHRWAPPTDPGPAAAGIQPPPPPVPPRIPVAPPFPDPPAPPPFPAPPAPPAPPTPSAPSACNGPPIDPHDRPDNSRAGAVWVTATGALLILASATVFVAVRWDRLTDALKLAILIAASGGFLAAGRSLRSRLPATSSVLYHLGAFLIPVVVAAIAVHQGLSWPAVILTEGLTALVGFPLLNRTERSWALRWATVVGGIATAGGFAGVTGWPAPLVLAGMAVAVATLRHLTDAWNDNKGRDHFATAVNTRHDALLATWVITAGIAPVFALATTALRVRPGVLTGLGLAATTESLTGIARLAPLTSGLLCTAVLLAIAHRRKDLTFVVLGAGTMAVGVTTTFALVKPGASSIWPGVALLFLLTEVIAACLRHDPFWVKPARWLANGAEAIALTSASITVAAAIGRWHLPLSAATSGLLSLSLSGVLATAAWLIADQRRRVPDASSWPFALLMGSSFPLAAPAIATTVTAMAMASRWSPMWIGVTMLALAAIAVLSARPWAHATAGTLAVAAPLLAVGSPTLCLGLAVGGTLVLGYAAHLRLVTRVTWSFHAAAALLCTSLGSLTVALISMVAARMSDRLSLPNTVAIATLTVVAVAAWTSSWWTDRLVVRRDADRITAPPLAPPPDAVLAWIGRVGAFVVLFTAPFVGPLPIAVSMAAVTLLVIIDAVATRRPATAHLAAVSIPILATTGAVAIGYGVAASGVAAAGVTVFVAIMGGVTHLRSHRRGRAISSAWFGPFIAVELACAGAALALSSTGADALGSTLILLGGTGAAFALFHRNLAAGIAASTAATAGVWLHLDHGGVEATDAYAAPIAVLLFLAGLLSRSSQRAEDPATTDQPTDPGRVPVDRMSSWVAYGPAMLAIGVTGMIERLGGGPDIHALVVGGVAIAGILIGGTRRLAAPLLLGTVLLAALSWHELLGVEVGVPTWGWLAGAGALLVGAGVLMERHETGPIETGRRVVDTISERFS